MNDFGPDSFPAWNRIRRMMDGYPWTSGDLIPAVTGAHLDVWIGNSAGEDVSRRSHPVVGYFQQIHDTAGADASRTIAAVDYYGMLVPIDVVQETYERRDGSKSRVVLLNCYGSNCKSPSFRASIRKILAEMDDDV